jgi:FkbM family methyltransferase
MNLGKDNYMCPLMLTVLQQAGGLNGIHFSNTYWFHRALGWRGVLIEPTPASYKQLTKNRPSDITIHSAICKNYRDVHYITSAEATVDGIWEFMSKGFKERWHPNVKEADLPSIACVPLQSILALVNLQHIDFFSLDVEGGELEVIQSINFDCSSFDVIAVEADGSNPTKDQAVIDVLTSHGYILHGHVHRNDWFVHHKFVPSAMG